MGEAKRRGSREVRVAEGITKEQQRRLELDRLEHERMMSQPRVKNNKSRQLLTMMLGIVAANSVRKY